MDLSSARAAFFFEARDQRAILEKALLDSEAVELDEETFNLMFRVAHTIKGSAGLFGMDAIVRFTHLVENVLDRLRSGEVTLSKELVSLLLAANDHIGLLLDVVEHDDSVATVNQPGGEELMTKLLAFSTMTHIPGDRKPQVFVTPSRPQHPVEEGLLRGKVVASSAYHLSVRFAPNLFETGIDPTCFLRFLKTLGEIKRVIPVFSHLPPLLAFNPEVCYFGFDVQLASDADAERILNAFDFVIPGTQVELLPPHAQLSDFVALRARLPEAPEEIAARWLACGALTEAEAAELHAEAAEEREGELHEGNTGLTASQAAASRQIERRSADNQYIKVEASKLDRLINKVGELVIASDATTAVADRRRDIELTESVKAINQLVADIRDDALKLRMVIMGEVFGRFPRVVRDASEILGKQIELVIKGAEAEIDKSMVEKLTDPLMHLVRNAIDHGIETPELRLARGKPVVGTVELRAYHDSSCVVIEVADDGGGLNRDKILAKAIEKNLVSAGTNLSDTEVFKLIFQPGFSTAEKITDLSGRGVGMDVVRRNIEALRGSIEILNSEEQGTTFRIRLPLTLAIIDGFRVQVGDTLLVVPVDMMYECVEMPADLQQDKARQINLRGEWLPYISLRELFQLGEVDKGSEYVVIVQYSGRRAGLVVDRLLGEFQAVIKPLGIIFKALQGISGSTILGNGEPALILDIPQLVQFAWKLEHAQIRRNGNSSQNDVYRVTQDIPI
ncbi:chemotaxis protein CheA [Chitinimonas sp. BJB300]|nr:chemotaxis protein CheA [Chitinimonas sp. BJB300]TSJ86136.1 chemotaxis protein CheA [Chitinimonas sp. BJB300]